jgi:hypothetical protein
MSPNVPMQRPAAASSFHAIIRKTFSSLMKREGGPVQIRVNGDVVQPGKHTAEVLGLLGIVEEEIDDAFWSYVGQGHWPLIVNPPQFDEYAASNQQGAGWEIEATVTAGKGVDEVRDLAYVDAREVRRYLTFRVRDWNQLTYKQFAENGFDGSVGRTSTLSSSGRPLESGGAVGSWYSGVNGDEINETVKAANALKAARMDLRRAFDEMDVAIRVADAAWKGDRADAAKYKFALEASVLEPIIEVAHAWEDFTQDAVRQQRLAKDHDDKFKREIATELAITVAVGVISFGAGALIKGSLFAAKLGKWARDVEVLRKALETRHGQTLARVGRSAATGKSIRVIARTMGDLSTVAAIRHARGEPVTANDWLFSFLFAGVIGQGTSDLAKWGLRGMESKFGISFKSPMATGGLKGSVQGEPRGMATHFFTDASFGRVMSAYGVGIPAEALKETTKTKVRREVLARLKDDPALRREAEAAVRAQHRRGNQSFESLVARELERRADRAVDPLLDYIYAAGTRAAVNGANTAAAGPGTPPPKDFRPGPGGLVIQPVERP